MEREDLKKLTDWPFFRSNEPKGWWYYQPLEDIRLREISVILPVLLKKDTRRFREWILMSTMKRHFVFLEDGAKEAENSAL